MGERHPYDVINAQGVAPDGVLTDVRSCRRLEGLMREGNHLALLAEAIVAVHILQGIDPVLAGSHTLDDEMSRPVSAPDTYHGLLLESRVGQIAVQSDGDTLDGLQVLGIDDTACHLEGVNLLACGEDEGIVAHRVALIVVGDGIAEVDGIGAVGLQRVLQLHDNLLVDNLDFGHLQLGGRHHDILRRIVELDVFVEVDGNLLGGDIGIPLCRYGADDTGRVVIEPAAIGCSHSRTRHKGAESYQDIEQFSHLFSLNS